MTMQSTKLFANPWVILFVLWGALLILLLIGPIDYPGQPSLAALAAIGAGALIFLAGHFAGVRLGRILPNASLSAFVPPSRAIDRVMIVTSLLGIVGILLIGLDRQVLSGIDNANYAAALRCAPEFIEVIQIQRTPLIYIGYLTFSFGFASVALFLLRAEEVRGWAAYLAQASIISPVGYAVLYSGRMPILLMLTLLLAVGLVRIYQGRSLLPRGHYLLLKALIFVAAFAIYMNAMWASRQHFCAQIQPVIIQLREMVAQKAKERAERKNAVAGMDSSDKISAQNFAALIQNRMAQVTSGNNAKLTIVDQTQNIIDIMREAWGVAPRAYVKDLLQKGAVSPSRLIGVMSNYFYLTHGVMTLDRILTARDQLEPVWGVYEVGVLSPILRVFFPANKVLDRMGDELTDAKIYGFFPTVWGAAIVDFGILGAVVYIFIWGGLGGWAYALSGCTKLVTPVMGLAFVLASIFLSPIQGPIGLANSALVLLSMLATGLLVDFGGRFLGGRSAG
jgi:hypothetical protein